MLACIQELLLLACVSVFGGGFLLLSVRKWQKYGGRAWKCERGWRKVWNGNGGASPRLSGVYRVKNRHGRVGTNDKESLGAGSLQVGPSRGRPPQGGRATQWWACCCSPLAVCSNRHFQTHSRWGFTWFPTSICFFHFLIFFIQKFISKNSEKMIFGNYTLFSTRKWFFFEFFKNFWNFINIAFLIKRKDFSWKFSWIKSFYYAKDFFIC